MCSYARTGLWCRATVQWLRRLGPVGHALRLHDLPVRFGDPVVPRWSMTIWPAPAWCRSALSLTVLRNIVVYDMSQFLLQPRTVCASAPIPTGL
jgi:hypothetical protein